MEAVIQNILLRKRHGQAIESYAVVHPLFDEPEDKIDTDAAGPMKMTKSVKMSLITLRCYLIVMIGLAFYRSLVLAGVL